MSADDIEQGFVLAERWKDIHDDESHGQQGKNLGILARTLLEQVKHAERIKAAGVALAEYWEKQAKCAVPEGRQTDPDASDPQTKGSWEKRCAALYQVIGALASYSGIFSVSDDVADALDVAAGDGDVEKLLPWPKEMKLFTALEEHCKGLFDMNDGEGKK